MKASGVLLVSDGRRHGRLGSCIRFLRAGRLQGSDEPARRVRAEGRDGGDRQGLRVHQEEGCRGLRELTGDFMFALRRRAYPRGFAHTAIATLEALWTPVILTRVLCTRYADVVRRLPANTT